MAESESELIETKFEQDVKQELMEIKQDTEELKTKIDNFNPPIIG